MSLFDLGIPNYIRSRIFKRNPLNTEPVDVLQFLSGIYYRDNRLGVPNLKQFISRDKEIKYMGSKAP